jgi:TfoX/Sxy family transcriptional regulator of competence genes
MLGSIAIMAEDPPEDPMSMPSFSKSPADLVERFAAITADLPDVVHRQMFGYPCLFVGGNLVSGLYQASWHVRLAKADQAELLAVPGAGPFEPMPGRPMTGYVILPPSIVADDVALLVWLDRAIEFGRGLPPKPSAAGRKRGG